MEVRFRHSPWARLEVDPRFDAGLDPAVVKAYRKKLHAIRAASDERDLRAMKSWRFEKLQGNRSHQWSMRLNDQWRLILEFEGSAPNKVVVVIEVADYH